MLSIVSSLEEFWGMFLGADLHVFTDHKNLTFDTLKTQCVLCWLKKNEVFSPMLCYIKGTTLRAPLLQILESFEVCSSVQTFTFLWIIKTWCSILSKLNGCYLGLQKMKTFHPCYTTSRALLDAKIHVFMDHKNVTACCPGRQKMKSFHPCCTTLRAPAII